MKKIYPCSVLTIILELFFLAVCGLCVYVFIGFIFENSLYGYLVVISSVIVFVLSFIIILSFILKRIVITEKDISVKDDIADKRGVTLRRLQYKTTVYFDEIEKIHIFATNKDSRGKSVKNVFVSMPYLVFTCKDGKEKRINVLLFSKRQVIYIVDEIKRRALLLGNDIQAESGKKLVSEIKEEYEI